MEQPILYKRDGDVATLTINRPRRRNALNWAAQEQFAAAMERLASESALRLLIITGAGDSAFASGGDLKELADHLDQAGGQRLNATMSDALAAMTRLPFPVMAAVNGDAVGGGCEIITACDLRLASPSARFRFAQVQMGLTTGWGGAARLVRDVGLSRATELLLTGREIDADEAKRIGLIQRLAGPQESALAAAYRWAADLLALPAGAQTALKALLQLAASRDDAGVRAEETRYFTSLWGQPDHLGAMAAFMNRARNRQERP
ncbi:MAG: enoyl-CoA hydratase/isomerase family protein [Candidatus Promineifilaceae bacterium]|nr:enoyl-CoA hydratase/isomerase family protein [Candidatus Promineifilaceae bacterium]